MKQKKSIKDATVGLFSRKILQKIVKYRERFISDSNKVEFTEIKKFLESFTVDDVGVIGKSMYYDIEKDSDNDSGNSKKTLIKNIFIESTDSEKDK